VRRRRQRSAPPVARPRHLARRARLRARRARRRARARARV